MRISKLLNVPEDGLAARVFNNRDFGYYKVSIDRPNRLKAQFSAERLAGLRFDKSISEPMQWAYETYGELVYTDLKSIEKELLDWCEKNEVDLNTKKRKALTNPATWQKQQDVLNTAGQLMSTIGTEEHNDYNVFLDLVNQELLALGNAEGKAVKTKLSASEKNQILGAVSWYDESAEKVIKKKQKLSGDKLSQTLTNLNCTVGQLPDYGYYPSGNKDEYIIYDHSSDLRDTESVPLTENIHDYFLREVKPHVAEAWIDLDKTKIGYEISFNKYFYQHKLLRSIEEVSAEILGLEKENEGLIMDILNIV